MTLSTSILRRLPPVLATFAALGVVCAAVGYPVPAGVPSRWELDFRPGELRLYHDRVDSQYYWYFSYSVTNRTGEDQTWAPTFVLFHDGGEILNSGIGVPAHVTEAMMDMFASPFVENQYEIIGEILQGREHMKEGVVFWPARNFEITEMSLFIGGISGETARIAKPLTGEELLLRKTLQRNYLIPGNAAARGSRPVELIEQTWVFR